MRCRAARRPRCSRAASAAPPTTARRRSGSPPRAPSPRRCASGSAPSSATCRSAAWSRTRPGARPTRSRATPGARCPRPPATCALLPGSSTTSGTAAATADRAAYDRLVEVERAVRDARPGQSGSTDADRPLAVPTVSIDRGPGLPSLVITADGRAQARRWRGPVILVVVVLAFAVLLAVAQGHRNRGYLDPDAVDPSGSRRARARCSRSRASSVVRVTSAEAARDALYEAQGSTTLLVAAELAPVSARMADMVEAAAREPPRGAGRRPRVGVPPGPPRPADGLRRQRRRDRTRLRLAHRRSGSGRSSPRARSTRLPAPTSSACWDAFVLDLGATAQATAGDRRRLGQPPHQRPARRLRQRRAGPRPPRPRRDRRVVAAVDRRPAAARRRGRRARRSPTSSRRGSPWPSRRSWPPPWSPCGGADAGSAASCSSRCRSPCARPRPSRAAPGSTAAAGARGRAADVLRAATTARLAALLRLPRSAGLAEVVPAVAARTGRDATAVAALLTPGADPTDDASLTRLADALDTLEDEVRRS